MVRHARGERGSLQPLLLLALLAITLAGFGIWGLMRRWRHLAETQLRLDRCAGQEALAMRDFLNGLDAANHRIRELRAAVATAGAVAPEAATLARAAIRAEAARQDLAILGWRARSARWWLKQGCGGRGDRALPLPEPGLSRPPPDPLGQRPLEWDGGAPGRFRIQLAHPPRAAAASIETKGGGFLNAQTNVWTARWTGPELGASVD